MTNLPTALSIGIVGMGGVTLIMGVLSTRAIAQIASNWDHYLIGNRIRPLVGNILVALGEFASAAGCFGIILTEANISPIGLLSEATAINCAFVAVIAGAAMSLLGDSKWFMGNRTMPNGPGAIAFRWSCGRWPSYSEYRR